MHEWVLAEAIVKAVINIAKQKGALKVTEVNVIIGELQQLNLEVFKQAFKTLSKGTLLENSSLNLKIERVTFKCRMCGASWGLKEIVKSLDEDMKEAIHFIPEVVYAFIRCPNCGSVDFEAIKGRHIQLESIKVIK